MPIPVTTTRLMVASSAFSVCSRHAGAAAAQAPLGCAASSRNRPTLRSRRAIDHRAVGREPAVGDAEHQLGAHHALDVDAVDDLLDVRQHLAGELHLADAERAAAAGRAEPAEEEADHLPQRVEPEAARHHRVALEMTGEEPEVRACTSSSARTSPLPYSPPASAISEIRSNISIGGSGSCGPSANNSPRAAGEQVLVLEARAARVHSIRFPRRPARPVGNS